MNDQADIDWNADGQLEVLTFDLKDETFAIEAGLVREIFEFIPETPVPGSAPLVSSVINFRGRVIPLADLRLAFDLAGLETTLDSRIIVIEFNVEGEACLIGLKADKVHEVTTLDRAATESPPRIGMRWRRDFIRCLAKRGDNLIVVPNLERIFAVHSHPERPAAPAGITQH